MLQVADLYLAGATQAAIADQVEVSRQQVGGYLKTLQARWQVSATEAISVRKARELAKIDRLEREHWDAWERSRQNAQTKVVRTRSITLKVKDAAGQPLPADETETTLTTIGQVGDPRFLQGVESCIELRLKITGGFAQLPVETDWRAWLLARGVDPVAFFGVLVAQAMPRLGAPATEPAAPAEPMVIENEA